MRAFGAACLLGQRRIPVTAVCAAARATTVYPECAHRLYTLFRHLTLRPNVHSGALGHSLGRGAFARSEVHQITISDVVDGHLQRGGINHLSGDFGGLAKPAALNAPPYIPALPPEANGIVSTTFFCHGRVCVLPHTPIRCAVPPSQPQIVQTPG
jgi:hypothetical protein